MLNGIVELLDMSNSIHSKNMHDLKRKVKNKAHVKRFICEEYIYISYKKFLHSVILFKTKFTNKVDLNPKK